MALNEFMTAVLQGLGMNASPGRMEFMREWAAFESGRGVEPPAADFNYLNTTLHMPGDRDLGNDPTQNNGNPVREYPNFNTGVQATVLTLMNGRYPSILRTLDTGVVSDEAITQIGSVWGSTSFATQLRNGWRPAGWPVMGGGASLTLEQRMARLEALVAGNGADAKDGTRLRGEAALADQAARGNSFALGLAMTQASVQQLAFVVANLATGASTEAVIDALQKILDAYRSKK